MSKYLLIYRSEAAPGADPPAPEEQEATMKLWGDWIGQGFASGWMVDGGDALLDEGRVVAPDKNVTDGPFAESKELVGGFSIIQAESLDAAAEIAKGCPALRYGSVEIRTLAGFGGAPD